MATIVEIENSVLEDLSEYVEKMLKYGGKVMTCIERLKEEEGEEEGLVHRKPRKRKSMKDDDEEYLRYY